MPWHPDTPQNYRNEIVLGNAKEFSKTIPDESIDLIFTDPVYSNLDDYVWLAKESQRVLKQNRAVLVWCSTPKSFEIKNIFEREKFTYVYTLLYTVVAKSYRMRDYHLFCWTTPCLWFSKGKFRPMPWIIDTIISKNPPKTEFKWNKNQEPIEKWINSFSKEDDVVWDPFTGYGAVPKVCQTLKRNFIASEINPDVHEMAIKRLENVPNMDSIGMKLF